MKTLGTALRGTNVKSQMLSFQIFTGLRAISSLQINGAIGNERGQRGPRQSRLLGTTNPDFLVSRGHTRARYLTHTHAWLHECVLHARVHYYQYGRGDVRLRRGASPFTKITGSARIKPQKFFAATTGWIRTDSRRNSSR